MNPSNSNTIRCPHCNLVNFANSEFCKRCKNSLTQVNYSTDPNNININITLPRSIPPQNPYNNYNQSQFNQPPQQFNQPQFNRPQEQFNQPQVNQPAPPNSSEYQLQNQMAFQQWQQQQRPQQAPVYSPFQPPQTNAIYRYGSELVIHRYAKLPQRCVKCNEYEASHSATSYVKEKYRWHNPLVYIALISPLIYVILSAALSQRAQVDIPLCHKHIDERNTNKNYMIGGGLLALFGIFFFGSIGYGGLAVLLFFAALIGLPLFYEYRYKALRVSKIENDYVFLKGADDELLNHFPYC